MSAKIQKLISISFYTLFILLPLALYPKTSEIFEFNKMVTTYALTALISGLWVIRMIFEKRIIFRRTLLDVPLIIFLSSQLLSTVFSIDPRTSFLGYYSRFNGGLLSSLCYALLYWSFTANLGYEQVIKSLKILFVSTFLASLWGIFEHFGHSFSCLIFPDFGVFDVSCWVQDVRTRVFSSFGQPNWLAAWLTAVIPITWAFSLNEFFETKLRKRQLFIYCLLSAVFFTTLLFTKSRSGILGFAVAAVIFWTFELLSAIRVKRIFKLKMKEQKIFPAFLILNILILISVFSFGTPWTPSIPAFLKSRSVIAPPQVDTPGPALETGGTESGKIRKIVWKGALDVWKNYPIFGSGVETFAYSYYQFRPTEHNLTSEWDYLYNKAHNEYLNFAATTGTFGLLSYLSLIGFSLFLIYKNSLPKLKTVDLQDTSKVTKKTPADIVILDINHLSTALLAGYVSILITNFFGFSVVPVAVLFFIFPAFAFSLIQELDPVNSDIPENLNPMQKILSVGVTATVLYLLSAVFHYWNSDLIFAKAKMLNEAGDYQQSFNLLSDLVKSVPAEAIYWDELADSSSYLAASYTESSSKDQALNYSKASYSETINAISLSPANVNLKRKASTRLINLSAIDPGLLLTAKNILVDAVAQAPTDAKLHYNLALSYLRTGDYENAIKAMEETIRLKPDYEKAHYGLALMYVDNKQKDKAKAEFEYILKNINPANADALRELNELK